MRFAFACAVQDTALVQFSNAQQASIARMHLNNAPLFGQVGLIGLQFSRVVRLG